MDLFRYSVDFSSLSDADRENCQKKIEGMADSGLALNPKTQHAEFMIPKNYLSRLSEIPAACHLTRLP